MSLMSPENIWATINMVENVQCTFMYLGYNSHSAETLTFLISNGRKLF